MNARHTFDRKSPFNSIELESSNSKHSSFDDKDQGIILNSKELHDIAIILIKYGIPTSISCICLYSAGLVCLRYAGKYGNANELAGVALGFTWTSMFGFAIISSINQGFSVLAAQLYGARKFNELGALLQKNLFILSIVLIPLLMTFYFADIVLLNLGLDYEVSINTGIYLKHAIPSLIGLAFFECLRFYLIAQNFFYIQPIIQGSLTIVHIFWCYVFVYLLDMPVAGVAIAKSITDLSSAVVLWLYIRYTNICSESWLPWDRASLDNWMSYLKQTLVLGANSYIEWVSYEVSLFIVGMLHNQYALGAHGVAISLISSVYMLTSGNSYAMQAYIGNAVGEGAPKKAQKFLVVGLGINFVIALINTIVLVGWSGSIAQFFTDDDQTRDILQIIILMYGTVHIIDTSLGHLSGALKILGREKEVLIWFCTTYMLIGVNSQWIFGVFFEYGFRAIWASYILGMCLMCVWCVIQFVRLDWEAETVKIRERIEGFNAEDKKMYIEMI